MNECNKLKWKATRVGILWEFWDIVQNFATRVKNGASVASEKIWKMTYVDETFSSKINLGGASWIDSWKINVNTIHIRTNTYTQYKCEKWRVTYVGATCDKWKNIWLYWQLKNKHKH